MVWWHNSYKYFWTPALFPGHGRRPPSFLFLKSLMPKPWTIPTCATHIYPLQMYGESCCRGTHHHGWRKSGSVAVADTVKRHLDSQPSFVRILFMDFTSAINTVNINTLLHHLQQLQFNPTLMLWIKEFLRNRPQHARVHCVTSTNTILNTGVPQGCVFPFLYTQMRSPARSMD